MLTRFLQTSAFKQLLLLLIGVLFISSALGFRKWGTGVPAGVMAGKTESVKAKTRVEILKPPGVTAEQSAASIASLGDSDGDGIPDAVELRSFNDRENFRRWFTAIAEMQFYEWSAEQRDCAGLVRFSWREALRQHDREWFQRMGREYEPLAPDVAAYTLESNPLGEKLFRTNSAALKSDDTASDAFSAFADARSLKDFNSVFIGRDRRRAQPGDLVFFFQPWVQKLPYHVMIFLGEGSMEASGRARDWVVYHTGASASDAGTVKKVRLSVLERHPDKRWRPIESNPNFLGFYRLKILD
jgi:uncharacterized protein YfaT (DUF1175 family)